MTVPALYVTVIGVGNCLRGDDAIGLIVARRLRAQLPSSVTIIESSGDVPSLLEAMVDEGSVILLDAMRSGAPPGAVRRFDALRAPLPPFFAGLSTHTFGVAEIIELARTLGTLPRQLIVYGLEGQDFSLGADISSAVSYSIDHVVATVISDLWLQMAPRAAHC